jgi:glycosyltransferase involved in cell wall biosynthesis
MKILVDATSLLLRSAGIKNYVWHWLRAMRAASRGHEISAFPMLRDSGELDHSSSVYGLAGTWSRLGLVAFLNLPGNPGMNFMTGGADVFHASNMVRNVPVKAALTATIHDLTCRLMPEFHTPANIRADEYYARSVLSRARGLIAISESTKRDAVRELRLDPERIEVIYSGIDRRFFDAVPSPAPKAYVLSVSTIEPRKNLDTLLDAWAQLPDDVREQFDLVLAGPAGWKSEATMARIQSTSGVRYLGYVEESRLPGLTAGATVFVFPSLYEGFGFPPAQAMAAGVPAIVSNVSSLPEVAGDAALLIDPRSAGELASAILLLLTSPRLRAELGPKSRQQAMRFNWDDCARRSLDFFERVVGR